MFDAKGVDDEKDTRGLALAKVGPGTRALALIDGKVVVMVAPLGSTGPVQRTVVPAPPGGRVIDLGWGDQGPVAVTANGTCSCWSEIEQKWQRFGNLRGER